MTMVDHLKPTFVILMNRNSIFIMILFFKQPKYVSLNWPLLAFGLLAVFQIYD